MVNLKAAVAALMSLIIVLVVVITAIGETTDDVKSAGNSINQSEQCAAAGCTYNGSYSDTAQRCRLAGDDTSGCATGSHEVTLSGFYEGDGIVLLVWLGVALLAVIGLILGVKIKN